jgi:hypothetical protein
VTGSGFQVALEVEGRGFGIERSITFELPRATGNRRGIAAAIVVCDTLLTDLYMMK